MNIYYKVMITIIVFVGIPVYTYLALLVFVSRKFGNTLW